MSTLATIDELPTLSDDDLDAIQGAWVANAVGAGVGAISGGVSSYISSGGNWRQTAVGALTGGVMGAVSPVSSVGNAVRAVGMGVASGVVGAGAERVVPGRG